MILIFSLVLVNVIVVALAIVGLNRGRRSGIGFNSGISALVLLPLADISLLALLLGGIPYFNLMTFAGVSLLVTGGLAVLGATLSFVLAMRGRGK
ncbi:hypothetical protein [Lysobacter sp. F6437]|uniref:hypothetical protein n=1 Tax=Lysobacter sp. F6437 TaxID=3459296 RepID=UPI00403DB55C